jgi:hypothetical protein
MVHSIDVATMSVIVHRCQRLAFIVKLRTEYSLATAALLLIDSDCCSS